MSVVWVIVTCAVQLGGCIMGDLRMAAPTVRESDHPIHESPFTTDPLSHLELYASQQDCQEQMLTDAINTAERLRDLGLTKQNGNLPSLDGSPIKLDESGRVYLNKERDHWMECKTVPVKGKSD